MNKQPHDIDLTRKQLSHLKGFCGLGWGLKEIGSCPTGMLCWRVYVQRKIPVTALPVSQIIPPFINGIATDVIARTPAVQCHGLSPAAGGELVANAKGVPGTLGCIAYSSTKKENVFLTNYHVLFSNGAKEGDTVWLVRKEKEKNFFTAIGRTLHGKIGIIKYEEEDYYIDCAIAHSYRQDISSSHFIRGCNTAEPGMIVSKQGSVTSFSKGIVTDICYPDSAFINGIHYNAPRQVLIKPLAEENDNNNRFSAEGDSGSVIVDQKKRAVALLWGSNAKGEGIACHIRPVVHELGIMIDTRKSRFNRYLKQSAFFRFFFNDIAERKTASTKKKNQTGNR